MVPTTSELRELQPAPIDQLDVSHGRPRRLPGVLFLEAAAQRGQNSREIIVERACCADRGELVTSIFCGRTAPSPPLRSRRTRPGRIRTGRIVARSPPYDSAGNRRNHDDAPVDSSEPPQDAFLEREPIQRLVIRPPCSRRTARGAGSARGTVEDLSGTTPGEGTNRTPPKSGHFRTISNPNRLEGRRPQLVTAPRCVDVAPKRGCRAMRT
jgi:hypothetical protein